MFEAIAPAPPDAILGLTEAFNADPHPEKISLAVGVYKDEHGKTPTLHCVREAEARLARVGGTKSYRPIDGAATYGAAVRGLLFGADHALLAANRAVTAQTPGGTGALRVAADYLHQLHPDATVHLSEPTWANHNGIFSAAGVPTRGYPYFDAKTNGLAFDQMIAALEQVPAGDVVLLHACCHNPSGVDPTPDQWDKIATTLASRGVAPLVDFAYQGFARGLNEDAEGLLALAARCDELLVCSSFSKNFGLYNDRVGALTVVAGSADAAAAVLSHVKRTIRTNYSNPPAHGGDIVETVLADDALRSQWLEELARMRDRINGMRARLAAALDARGLTLPGGDNQFITRQYGMFSFSGLDKQQVETLRNEWSIYVVGNGRINVAGLTEDKIDRVCDALAAVL